MPSLEPSHRYCCHPEQLVHGLRRFLDGLNHLMCRRDGKPGWAQERSDKSQPRDMALVVLRLRGRGPNALLQQVLPQVELDRRDRDAGLRRQFRNSHGTPHLTLDSATLQYWRVALSNISEVSHGRP